MACVIEVASHARLVGRVERDAPFQVVNDTRGVAFHILDVAHAPHIVAVSWIVSLFDRARLNRKPASFLIEQIVAGVDEVARIGNRKPEFICKVAEVLV